MVGVQHQRDVERVRRQAARPLAGQHVEEIRRVSEHRIRRDRAQPPSLIRPIAATSELICDGEPHGLAIVRLRRVVGGVGVVVAERGGQRPQQVHRRCRPAATWRSAERLPASPATQPAATADRPAPRASAAAGATAGNTLLRTWRDPPDRGCRSRSRPARRDRRRDSRSRTTWRRYLRGPLWVSLAASLISMITHRGVVRGARCDGCEVQGARGGAAQAAFTRLAAESRGSPRAR